MSAAIVAFPAPPPQVALQRYRHELGTDGDKFVVVTVSPDDRWNDRSAMLTDLGEATRLAHELGNANGWQVDEEPFVAGTWRVLNQRRSPRGP